MGRKKSQKSIIQLPFSLWEEILLKDWCVENNVSYEKSQELWAAESSPSSVLGIPVTLFKIHVSLFRKRENVILFVLSQYSKSSSLVLHPQADCWEGKVDLVFVKRNSNTRMFYFYQNSCQNWSILNLSFFLITVIVLAWLVLKIWD